MSETPSVFIADKEIRFGIVLYGGVSLAIYINGVTQELLHLIRSTALPSGNLSDVEKIYFDVAKHLGGESQEQIKFTVDVIAGTSAGGINGVFLGKALALGQSMEQIRKLWVELGDIDKLLNDESSVKALKRYELNRPAQSLLNSQAMYAHLLRALREMDDAQDRTAPLSSNLDLYITATDLEGLILPIQLADRIVFERKHKAVFHFSAKQGADMGFSFEFNPQLAFAARCTSSFPVAFEPMCQSDTIAVLENESILPANPQDKWDKLFADFRGDRLATVDRVQTPYPDRSFADGGYLDNKPFSYVIDKMENRPTFTAVERKLIYIEPDPDDPTLSPAMKRRPNAVENSLLGLSALPRYETIREDLDRVLKRNENVRHIINVRDYLKKLHQTQQFQKRRLERMRVFLEKPKNRRSEWVDRDSNDLANEYGEAYLGYHRLKVSETTMDLVNWLAEYMRLDSRSVEYLTVQALVMQWRDETYGPWPEPRGGKGDRLNLFLIQFSVGYRLRRLRLLLDELDERRRATMEADRRRCIQLRQQIGALYKQLADLRPRPQDFEDMGGPDELRHYVMGQIYPGREGGVIEFSREQVSHAGKQLLVDSRELIDSAATKISNRFQQAFSESYGELKKILGQNPRFRNKMAEQQSWDQFLDSEEGKNWSGSRETLEGKLWEEFDLFEEIDVHLFPALYNSDIKELAVVDVVRVSPSDAEGPRLGGELIVDERAAIKSGKAALDEGNPRKLKGAALGAFGGFLDEEWRRNDMIWGRLDGAERLIQALLPGRDNAEVRRGFLERIHEAILEEELANNKLLKNEKIDESLPAVVRFAQYRRLLQATPDREASVQQIGRSMKILSEVLENLHSEPAPSPLTRALLWAGRFVLGMVALASQRTIVGAFADHWLRLLYLVGFVLIVFGTLLYWPAAQTGWLLLLTLGALHFCLAFIKDYLAQGSTVSRMALFLVMVVVCALCAIGSVQLPKTLASLVGYLPWLHYLSIGLFGLLVMGALKIAGSLKDPIPSNAMALLEEVRTVGDLERVAGDLKGPNRYRLLQAIAWDYFFLSAYGSFFVAEGLRCLINWDWWASWIAGFAMLAGGLLAAAFDVAENSRMERLLKRTLREVSQSAVALPESAILEAPGEKSLFKWLYAGCALAGLAAWHGIGGGGWGGFACGWPQWIVAIVALLLSAFAFFRSVSNHIAPPPKSTPQGQQP